MCLGPPKGYTAPKTSRCSCRVSFPIHIPFHRAWYCYRCGELLATEVEAQYRKALRIHGPANPRLNKDIDPDNVEFQP